MNEYDVSGWERLIRSENTELSCHLADEGEIEMIDTAWYRNPNNSGFDAQCIFCRTRQAHTDAQHERCAVVTYTVCTTSWYGKAWTYNATPAQVVEIVKGAISTHHYQAFVYPDNQ